jgi:alkylhydroperoxidase/carboxymuconolactone decarboxylase family protein YurZ
MRMHVLSTKGLLTACGLTLLVLSSKSVLILNEEILIGLSFLAFVATIAHTLQQTVTEAFDTRKTLLTQELQAFFTIKEALMQQVFHQADTQLGLTQCMQTVQTLAQKDTVALQTQREHALQNMLYTHMQKKMKNMVVLRKECQEAIEHTCVQGYKPTVLHASQLDQKASSHASMNAAWTLVYVELS